MLSLFAADDAAASGLWDNLVNLFDALWGVVVSLVQVVAPWTPLLAWIAFWLFAVNWVKLRQVMIQGGWIGVVLIGSVIVLVWGTVAPPQDGHLMLGMKLSNYVGKTVYVTVLFCIMFLCGSLQLSGFLPGCCRFPDEDEQAEDHAHAAH
ncbi:MAG: hypothetical protein ACE5KM_16275 [Planctomycetaceae bacterium]